MKHLSILGLGVLLVLTVLTGCSDESDPPLTPGMTTPVLHSLSVTPQEVAAGSSVIISADVERPMDIPMEYEWSVSGGQLVGSTTRSEVVWIAPTDVNKASVSCRVSNQYGSDERSLQVYLTPEKTSPQGIPSKFSVTEINTEYRPFRHDDASLTNDGGCYIAGPAVSDAGGYWIAKLDKNGNAEWEKPLPYATGDSRNSVLALPDGGCVIFGLGDRHDNTLDQDDAVIDDRTNLAVRLDISGEVVWEKDLGNIYCSGASLFPDGSIVLISIGDMLHVTKVSGNGEVLWRNNAETGFDFNCREYNGYWDVSVLHDNGILLFGKLYSNIYEWLSPDFRNYGTIVVKLSAEGEIEWTKSSVFDDHSKILDITDCHAGYLMAVKLNIIDTPGGPRHRESTVMGIDYAGNTLWEKPYDELKTLAAAISETEYGSLCVASTSGHSYSICSFDQTGDLIWSKNHELDFAEKMFDVWEYDGEYRTLFEYSRHYGFTLIELGYE